MKYSIIFQTFLKPSTKMNGVNFGAFLKRQFIRRSQLWARYTSVSATISFTRGPSCCRDDPRMRCRGPAWPHCTQMRTKWPGLNWPNSSLPAQNQGEQDSVIMQCPLLGKWRLLPIFQEPLSHTNWEFRNGGISILPLVAITLRGPFCSLRDLGSCCCVPLPCMNLLFIYKVSYNKLQTISSDCSQSSLLETEHFRVFSKDIQ